MRTTNRVIPFLVVAALLLSPVSLARHANHSSAASSASALATKSIFFAADGMRPDLMEKYAAQGVMPTYAALMRNGVKGDNGLVQAFPPNTGVGWYTLATGTYPSEHGSTNNTFFRSGDQLQQLGRQHSLQVSCRPIPSPKLPNELARRSSRSNGLAGRGR